MTQYNNLKLDHQLCFALYAATHPLTRAYRVSLKKIRDHLYAISSVIGFVGTRWHWCW